MLVADDNLSTIARSYFHINSRANATLPDIRLTSSGLWVPVVHFGFWSRKDRSPKHDRDNCTSATVKLDTYLLLELTVQFILQNLMLAVTCRKYDCVLSFNCHSHKTVLEVVFVINEFVKTDSVSLVIRDSKKMPYNIKQLCSLTNVA